MKKIFSILVLSSLALNAGAQGWEDAYMYSQNNYSGTARGIGIGNALTAVGGDPGSLTFNPAGSAVGSYSQITISPGLTVSSTGAAGMNSSYSAFKLPNAGFVINVQTGRRHGLKRWSYGFVMNGTDSYTMRMNASAVNAMNTFAGSLASSADGFSHDNMMNGSWYADNAPYWMDKTAALCGIVAPVGGADGSYVGVTEVIGSDGTYQLAGDIIQNFGIQTLGGKRDMLFNYAANFSDKLFVGVNLGISVMNYRINQYWIETPVNPAEFPDITYEDGTVAQFQSFRIKRKMDINATGLYGKIGLIYVPVPGVRFGAAVQTPTAYTMEEAYGYTGELNMKGKVMDPASSPEDRWQYDMTAPFRYNFGAAFALGSHALLSLDYEGCNYGQAGFHDHTEEGDDPFYDSGYFDGANQDIRQYLGYSHAIRAGVELKPVPAIALRAGYNYTASGIKDGSEGASSAVSLGCGLSTSKALYADFAFRMCFCPTQNYVPYYYYCPAADPSNPKWKDVDDGIVTPVVAYNRKLFEATLTLGWRF